MGSLLLAAVICFQAQEKNLPESEKIKAELLTAARNGDLATLKELLTKYPDLKDVRRNGGWTLLHMTPSSRDVVKYLISIGSDLEAKSGGLWTPLHSHAYNGHKDGVELLLEHGADIEAKTSFGITPLVSSLRWDRDEVTEFLLQKGANADAVTELGRTALITSAVEGNLKMIRLFLDYDADFNIRDHNYKRTALHFAALYGQLDIAAELLKKGAYVNEKDATGKTPLDYANKYGHKKVGKLLRSEGADGKIDQKYLGFSPYLKKTLEEDEAYAWYMGHAGYAVKTKNYFLLFNYSHNSGAGNPEEPHLANGRIHLDEIANCSTIVFAGSPHHSHHHPEIFSKWQNSHRNITFVYSFEDQLGRDPRYFKDVEGPKYIHLPDGRKKTIQNLKMETIPVSGLGHVGSGFLVEVDGLVIFYGGNHLLGSESQKEAFRKPIETLIDRGIKIDLLILPGNFAFGRIFPSNVEGLDYAVTALRPQALLFSGGDSTEFVLLEAAAALKKYSEHTQIFCPEHRGDMFSLKK